MIPKNDPIEALALCQRTRFDLALLDYEMPLMSGSKLAKEIKYLVPEFRCGLIFGTDLLCRPRNWRLWMLTSGLGPSLTISFGGGVYWCGRNW